MLISRGPVLGRVLRTIVNSTKSPLGNGQSIRNSGHSWSYRTAAPPAPKSIQIGAQLVGGLMWWWILWHIWHEPEHLTGEFPYPDPSSWTNEELGIPPDNYEEM